MDVTSFLDKVNALIINPLIILIFAVAFLIFFFGLFQFIAAAGESAEREKGKTKILYGIIGMVIMFSAYGLIHLVLSTFGIHEPAYISR